MSMKDCKHCNSFNGEHEPMCPLYTDNSGLAVNDKLRAENERLKVELACMTELCGSTRNDKVQILEENEQLRQKVKEAEDELNMRDKTTSEVEKQAAVNFAQVVALQKRVKEFEAKQESHDRDIDERNNWLAAQNHAKAKLEERVRELELERDQCKIENDSMHDLVKAYSDDRIHSKETIKQLTAMLEMTEHDQFLDNCGKCWAYKCPRCAFKRWQEGETK